MIDEQEVEVEFEESEAPRETAAVSQRVQNGADPL